MAHLTTLGRVTIIISWVTTTLAFISLALGTVARIYKLRSYPISECLVPLAFTIGVILVSQNTFTILVEGQAEHQNQLADKQINTLAKSIIIHEALWSLANALIRISACIYLGRIFHTGAGRGLLWLNFIVFLSTLHALACILDLSLICRPISAQWKSEINATCGNQQLSFVILESTAIALDFIILIFPLYPIVRLHIRTSQKWLLCIIFELGAILLFLQLGNILGITKLKQGSLFIIAGLRIKALSYATSPDFIYSKSYLGLLYTLGVILGITFCMASSFNLIFQMLQSVFQRFRLILETRGMIKISRRPQSRP